MSDFDLRYYLAILIKRLPLAIVIVGVCVLASIIVALVLQPIYRSTAKILIEQPDIPSEMVRSATNFSPVSQFQIIQQELTSRAGLVDLAKRLEVYPGKQPSDQDIAKNMRDRVHFDLAPLQQFGGQAPPIFEISFDASDPELAAKVAGELTTLVMTRNQQARETRAGETAGFFSREVERLKKALAAVDTAILDSRNANQGPFEQQTIQDLKKSLAEQLTLYEENSPNIIALRERIAALTQKSKEPAVDPTPSSESPRPDARVGEPNQTTPSVDGQGAQTALEQSGGSPTSAQTSGQTNETRLSALQRERENLQAEFTVAAARLSDASVSEQMEKRADGGRISIVEAAAVPIDRLSPNRRRIASLGLLAGIGLALAAMAALELLNQTIRRPSELADIIDAEPLVVIPYIPIETVPQSISERLKQWFINGLNIFPERNAGQAMKQ